MKEPTKRPLPTPLSEQGIAELKRQLEPPRVLRSIRQYAHRRKRYVERARKVDDRYADELIANVLADTVIGRIKWDPDRVCLKNHVMDAIQSRSRHDHDHGVKYHHDSIEDRSDEDADLGASATAKFLIATSLPPESERLEFGDIVSKVFANLQQLAAGDDEVLQLLAAYRRLQLVAGDVLIFTGFSRAKYRAVRKRLMRLLAHLPDELRLIQEES